MEAVVVFLCSSRCRRRILLFSTGPEALETTVDALLFTRGPVRQVPVCFVGWGLVTAEVVDLEFDFVALASFNLRFLSLEVDGWMPAMSGATGVTEVVLAMEGLVHRRNFRVILLEASAPEADFGLGAVAVVLVVGLLLVIFEGIRFFPFMESGAVARRLAVPSCFQCWGWVLRAGEEVKRGRKQLSGYLRKYPA